MRWGWRPACQSDKLQWRNAPPPFFSSLSVLKKLCFWYRGEDGFRSHGTADAVDYGDDYVAAARAFLSDWVDHADEMHPDALKPYQNAEKIAAAATG